MAILAKQDSVSYILLEFESDRMSPRESVKNEQNGAHGLNCKTFVNSDVIFHISVKNYSITKFLSFRLSDVNFVQWVEIIENFFRDFLSG